MKYSIKQQIALVFIVVMMGTLALCWVINNFFLESFYINNKEDVISDAYESINKATLSGDIASEEFDIELRKICDMYNISVLVIDAESTTIKSSSRYTEILMRRLYDNFFNPSQDLEYLEENDNYFIATAMDMGTGTEYLEMWGVLDNGNLFMVRSPLEGIRDSVKIANRFLAYIGIAATLISAVIILFVTTSITKPIMQLKDISEKMTNLDFETKYVSRGKNEIDHFRA